MDKELDPRRAGDANPKHCAGKKSWLKRLEDATGTDIDVRRRAAGRRPLEEAPILRFRCTKTRKPYTFVLREAKDGSFHAESVLLDKDLPKHDQEGAASSTETETPIERVKGSLIRECPYCGGRESFVLCHCGGLSCQGGGTFEDGEYVHKCPWCGSEGTLSGQIETLAVETVQPPLGHISQLDRGTQPQDALKAPD